MLTIQITNNILLLYSFQKGDTVYNNLLLTKNLGICDFTRSEYYFI